MSEEEFKIFGFGERRSVLLSSKEEDEHSMNSNGNHPNNSDRKFRASERGKEEQQSSTHSSNSNRKNSENMLKHTKRASSSSISPAMTKTEELEKEDQIQLPQRFVCKYLGFRETTNLWGIKYTRKPVDEMVGEAKKVLTNLKDHSLPLVKIEVTEEGLIVSPMPQNKNPDYPSGKFAIESISYGVQDLKYTRVFAMIVVKGENVRATNPSGSGSSSSNMDNPFRCHAFVCDSRQSARKLTYALASAFQKFSQNVSNGKIHLPTKPKKFAIDLRSPEDLETELIDSEA